MLAGFMKRVMEVYGARGGLVRIREGDKLMLMDSKGLEVDSPLLKDHVTVRSIRHRLGSNYLEISVQVETINKALVTDPDPSRIDHGEMQKIVLIPLQYRNAVLGCYEVLIASGFALDDEDKRLLMNIGQHLGAVIQQSQTDKDSGKLLVVEERTRLANDLHDSLAQTLASMRFQVRVLDETLHQGDEQVTWEELEKLENQVDEANLELRQLIGRFRAPLEHQEVVVSIKRLVEKFRQDTGVSVFLQNEWRDDELSIEKRSDVIGIVQEALANIRKHADANNVRIMIRHHGGRYRIMIEDDGRGMDGGRFLETEKSLPGQHIGHEIMQERAVNLGTKLKIESEIDEGCIVSVDFVDEATTKAGQV